MSQSPQMITYDIETYRNVFTLCACMEVNGEIHWWVFEISDRKNDSVQLFQFLQYLSVNQIEMVGFNNEGFDYPVVHEFMDTYTYCTAASLCAKAQAIIQSQGQNRFKHMVWDNQRYVKQIDLFKIKHFDNLARSTSLKKLEFAMRADRVDDLPFPYDKHLEDHEIDELIKYNKWDVKNTYDFLQECLEQIEFRREMSEKMGKNFMNFNDTKIGKEYFIMELERIRPGTCYYKDGKGKRQPRQTVRPEIDLSECIYPYIKFEQQSFTDVMETLRAKKITKTKGTFKGLSAMVDGFKFDFGLGGIHGSIDPCTVIADDEYEIWDWDVTSYYPTNAIANKVYPEHMGEDFCEIYEDVFNQRKSYKKGTVENAMLKLALNGVYGDSNNVYSPFYDPKYTMTITINGQLLLCMLAEQLMKLPSLRMIQINTDGLTVRVHKSEIEQMKHICKWWEDFTQLQLEHVKYSRMFIRDVNNYIGEYTDGKLKLKGAYEIVRDWHKNHSHRIVARAAVDRLVHGTDIVHTVFNCDDPFDFMMLAKVPRADQLFMTYPDGRADRMQGTMRYYVSIQGGQLLKVSPPKEGYTEGWYKKANGVLECDYFAWHEMYGNVWNEGIHTKNKSVYGERETLVESGWLQTECNDMSTFDWNNLNRWYYVEEANKLVEKLLTPFQ